MKFLITGIAGFVGSTLARTLSESTENAEVIGLDNFVRPGSERNRSVLCAQGVRLFHGDIRNGSDLEMLPDVDVVIDAAASPSVLGGLDGHTSSRQLVEHNLWGTVNLLEFCKSRRTALILLSTSRVYSIQPLKSIHYEVHHEAFRPRLDQEFPIGLSPRGVEETFSSQAPISLYGSTKLASEQLAIEYGAAFNFPVWVNRCGVLAGAGQFGRADQGIFSYWIHSYLRQKPLRYIGFDGTGHQVRDCLHPRDLVPLILAQINGSGGAGCIVNASGGTSNSMSLRQLSDWCEARFPRQPISQEATPRTFDIPWMVLDHGAATQQFGWRPASPLESILDEIADHAVDNPEWLQISASA